MSSSPATPTIRAIEASGPLAVQTLLSSPETGASNVRTMYYLSIVCARKSIYIANPYFVPDPVAIETLIEARKRGVDVRIMVSGIRNDNWLARHNSVRLFGRLLTPTSRFRNSTAPCCITRPWSSTGRWVTIGTTNFDNRSFAHNEESNVCFFDRELAEQLHQTFLDDLDGCEPITLDGGACRGLGRGERGRRGRGGGGEGGGRGGRGGRGGGGEGGGGRGEGGGGRGGGGEEGGGRGGEGGGGGGRGGGGRAPVAG